jgi:hypothetical protein
MSKKNLMRSKPQSCSLCGMQIFSVLQGCKIEVFIGPILKQFHDNYECYP